MNWIEKLKETIGVTDEKDVVDLTDMEERELISEQHLKAIADERESRTYLQSSGQD